MGNGIIFVLLMAVLAGCNQIIALRNEKTGDEVSCPREIKLPGRPPTQGCLNGYESFGYKQEPQEIKITEGILCSVVQSVAKLLNRLNRG
jgi:hypothetical protein